MTWNIVRLSQKQQRGSFREQQSQGNAGPISQSVQGAVVPVSPDLQRASATARAVKQLAF